MEVFSFLVKASICMAFFHLPNQLIFKKLKFYTLYRIYILFAICCSLVIPFLHLKLTANVSIPASNLSAIIAHQKNALDNFLIQPLADNTFDIWKWMSLIYIAIVAIKLIRLVYILFRILRTARLHGKKINRNTFVYNRHSKNSSFLNIIFINNKGLTADDEQKVIAHEQLHIEFKHSWDILFLEIVKSLFWFNPFIYLFQKDLQDAHEYQVDDALTSQFNPKDYAKLLVRLSSPPGTGILNQLSSNGLEKRISRIFNSERNSLKKTSYFLVIPIVFILTYFLSTRNSYAFNHNRTPFTLVIDAGHGGNSVGAVYAERTEKYYTLLMAKKIQEMTIQHGIKTILTRSTDESLDLPSRLKNKGDLLITLHLNADEPKKKPKTGLDIIISKENKHFENSKTFARLLHNGFSELDDINTNEIADSKGNFILRECSSAAVLIELGSIANNKDVNYISSEKGQTAISEKILKAIKSYHD